jgi:hydrogenase 3 maturation protease
MNSKQTWLESLQTDLKRLQKTDQLPRVALLGIGHPLYGDDAVGVWLSNHLRDRKNAGDRFLAVDAGPAPENFTGLLRRFKPDLVLLADAALMDLEPGMIGWLSWQDSTGFSASTHTLPLHILASYLTSDLGCEVALIGIQPETTIIGEPLTPKVRQAAEDVAKGITGLLGISGNL